MDQSILENKIIKIINSQVSVLTGFASSGGIGTEIWILLDKNFNGQSMIKAISMNVSDPQRVFIVKNEENRWEAYGLQEANEILRKSTSTLRHYKKKKNNDPIKPRFAFLLSRQATGSVSCSCGKPTKWIYKDGACRPDCSGQGTTNLTDCTGKRYSSGSPDGPNAPITWGCTAYITMWQPIKVTRYYANNLFNYDSIGGFHDGDPPADDSFVCRSTDIRPQYQYFPLPPNPPYAIDPLTNTYTTEPPLNEFTRWTSIEAVCLPKIKNGVNKGGYIESNDLGYKYYVTSGNYIVPGTGPHKPDPEFIHFLHSSEVSFYRGPTVQDWANAQMQLNFCTDPNGGKHPANPPQPPIKPTGPELKKREFYISGDRKKPLKVFELSESEPYNAWLTWLENGSLIVTFRHGCEDSKTTSQGGYIENFSNYCKVTILKIKLGRVVSKNTYPYNSLVENKEKSWRAPFINKYTKVLSIPYNEIDQCTEKYIGDNTASLAKVNKPTKDIYYPGYPDFDENLIIKEFANGKTSVKTLMHKFKGEKFDFGNGYYECKLLNELDPIVLKSTIENLFPPKVSYMKIECISPYIG